MQGSVLKKEKAVGMSVLARKQTETSRGVRVRSLRSGGNVEAPGLDSPGEINTVLFVLIRAPWLWL